VSQSGPDRKMSFTDRSKAWTGGEFARKRDSAVENLISGCGRGDHGLVGVPERFWLRDLRHEQQSYYRPF